MKKLLLLPLFGFLIFSCKTETKSTETETETETAVNMNKGQQWVARMVAKVGDYKKLAAKKNVTYTYTYQTPDGQKDVSTEKYLFNGEYSYGRYEIHQRTLPHLEGVIEQGFDGQEYWLKHNGRLITDEASLARVAFNRPTNYYWFAMMQKMLDPGLIYEYLGDTNRSDKTYAIVRVHFESQNEKPTDIYQLYINTETSLVDYFLFTVADFGVMETPFFMELTYEDVEGILIPSQRRYKASTWDAEISDAPWVNVSWSDITFNGDFGRDHFSPENN